MNQTGYRSALGGVAIRRKTGVRLRGRQHNGLGAGVDSRVQPTARLLAAYGQGAQAVATHSAGVGGLGAGVYSRVQPTARLLSRYGLPAQAVAAPSTAPPADAAFRAGVSGAAAAALAKGLSGIHWLAQGIGLALAAEIVTKAMKEPEQSPVETRADMVRAAREASNPFLRGSSAGPGFDAVIRLPVHGRNAGGMGQYGSAPTTVATTSASKGGGLLSAAGGPWGLAIMGVTTAITAYLGFRSRRNQRKVATTQIVDEAQPLLERNLEAWNKSLKTESAQKQALANYDAVWGEVVHQCSSPQMGTPGKWCIRDRERSGSWPWAVYWRDPIANDPNVTPDPQVGFRAVRDPETGLVTEVPTTETQMRNTLVPLVLAGAALYFVRS